MFVRSPQTAVELASAACPPSCSRQTWGDLFLTPILKVLWSFFFSPLLNKRKRAEVNKCRISGSPLKYVCMYRSPTLSHMNSKRPAVRSELRTVSDCILLAGPSVN